MDVYSCFYDPEFEQSTPCRILDCPARLSDESTAHPTFCFHQATGGKHPLTHHDLAVILSASPIKIKRICDKATAHLRAAIGLHIAITALHNSYGMERYACKRCTAPILPGGKGKACTSCVPIYNAFTALRETPPFSAIDSFSLNDLALLCVHQADAVRVIRRETGVSITSLPAFLQVSENYTNIFQLAPHIVRVET